MYYESDERGCESVEDIGSGFQRESDNPHRELFGFTGSEEGCTCMSVSYRLHPCDYVDFRTDCAE